MHADACFLLRCFTWLAQHHSGVPQPQVPPGHVPRVRPHREARRGSKGGLCFVPVFEKISLGLSAPLPQGLFSALLALIKRFSEESRKRSLK